MRSTRSRRGWLLTAPGCSLAITQTGWQSTDLSSRWGVTERGRENGRERGREGERERGREGEWRRRGRKVGSREVIQDREQDSKGDEGRGGVRELEGGGELGAGGLGQGRLVLPVA